MASENAKPAGMVFWTLCLMGAFAILSSTMSKNPVLKPFASSLGTPSEWIGFVASASTIPGILVSLPAASLSDILGRRRFLLIAGFVFASAPFMYLFISAWWELILVRFYHGFATAIFVPVAEAIIAESFTSKRGQRISLFSSATAVGRAGAPFMGGYVLFLTDYSYHTLYLVVGIAGLTALVTMLLSLAERKHQELADETGSSEKTMRRMLQGWSTALRNRGVLAVSLIQSTQYYTYGAVEFFLTGYLKEVVRMDPFLIGTVMGSQIIGIIIARPFMGTISDRTGRYPPIAVGSIVCGFPLLVIPLVSDFLSLLLLSITYGVGFAAVTASTSALVSDLMPVQLLGTSMGFLDMIMDVGQTLGPIFSGFILATSLQYAGLFASLTLILSVSCIVFLLSSVARADRKEYQER